MVINNYRPIHKDKEENKRGSILKWIIISLLILTAGVAIAAVAYELHTSRLQSAEVSRYASKLTYKLNAGPSDAIIFPENGPFDKRLGYVQLPKLLDKVQSQGMSIEYQTRFSPELLDYTSKGLFVPFQEKNQTGLHIVDASGEPIYHFSYPRRIYPDFQSVPSLVVKSLLFIENRELLDPERPFMNPAVDWGRFTKASMHEAANLLGFDYKTIGGSTLATQIEKYRHSPSGLTSSPREKLQQMASATVRAYQQGPESLPARQDLVLSYVNTVPLSGAPGYGEVHGIGDGLWVWFGKEFEEVNHILNLQGATGDTLKAQGQALRQVLSLMIAQRRPSYYLGGSGHAELNTLTGGYLRLLAKNGYITPELRDAGLAHEVQFRDFKTNPAVAPKDTDKGALMVRTHLSGLLGAPLYDLDRFDLAATSTLQSDLQEQVSLYLNNLNKPDFARSAGILGEHMLTEAGTQGVRYSFTLFERTPQGNLVRVQTDNTDQPFDINEGSKLELGSTAKLRVLVTYLEVIDEIHKRYATLSPQELRKELGQPHDNLTRWVLGFLLSSKDKSVEATLAAALERRYSASPYEAFFTGGGLHRFHNYHNEDNGRRPTVREAFLRSINLPFVRLMRDVVRYSTYQNVGDAARLLSDGTDPRRKEYLTRFADREGKEYLLRFWHKYKGKPTDERFEKLLSGMRLNEVRLAAVHRFLYPATDSVTFFKMLRTRLPEERLTDERVSELYHMYGPDAFNLSDQGYISRVHPLELWLLNYMQHNPETTWPAVVEASADARQEVYKWLFRTKYKSARDSRIRTMLELEAFDNIEQRWQKLGYPFNHLVPSLATALGSSGDRPEALAELMGIIMNQGVRQRTLRIEGLHFAAHTPYETSLKWQKLDGEQVMAPEVATAVRTALTEVVDQGTARRLEGGFTKSDGTPVMMGGKTGTGDNRVVTLSVRGHRIASRSINRTATFVFFLGDKHFGALTAYVPGSESADFHFTSSLPVQVLRSMAPIIEPYLQTDLKTISDEELEKAKVKEQKIVVSNDGKVPQDVLTTTALPQSVQ
ncbi:transglycosylase domain-containing protein [Pontibacter sp. MBLB2868]|uniref:transglycosylase domain-containing protein n=1 Tax=Pontibacter sp. MBLB2868 TaxID=3451555 RepID=UPI003F74F58E